MENSGEHLVGQYLKYIMNCDFLEYNLQTISTQGEIDVVGINTNKKKVYICEVATHLETGLKYKDNVKTLVSKFEKNIKYAEENFTGFEHKYMFWTPVVKIPKREASKNNQLKDIKDIWEHFSQKGIEIEMVYNEGYVERIEKLREAARNTKKELQSPIMRFLQIEEKLKNNLK